MTDNTFNILDRIINQQTQQGTPGLSVEAWDKDLIFDDLVGSDVTDINDRFSMTFDRTYFQECFGDHLPDLYFKVFRNGELIKSTEDSVLWNVKAGEREIVIEVREEIPEPERRIAHQLIGRLLEEGSGSASPVGWVDEGNPTLIKLITTHEKNYGYAIARKDAL